MSTHAARYEAQGVDCIVAYGRKPTEQPKVVPMAKLLSGAHCLEYEERSKFQPKTERRRGDAVNGRGDVERLGLSSKFAVRRITTDAHLHYFIICNVCKLQQTQMLQISSFATFANCNICKYAIASFATLLL